MGDAVEKQIDFKQRRLERGLSLDEYQTLILKKWRCKPLNDRPFNPPKRPPGTVVPLSKPAEEMQNGRCSPKTVVLRRSVPKLRGYNANLGVIEVAKCKCAAAKSLPQSIISMRE